jgi:hypothetical protein
LSELADNNKRESFEKSTLLTELLCGFNNCDDPFKVLFHNRTVQSEEALAMMFPRGETERLLIAPL